MSRLLPRFADPLRDWHSFDRWASVLLLVACGVLAVVCSQLSGLLAFYRLDCNGAADIGTLATAYWSLTCGPAAAVLLASPLVVIRARSDRWCWPIAVGAAVVGVGTVVAADALARAATAAC